MYKQCSEGPAPRPQRGRRKNIFQEDSFFQINKEVLGNHIKYLKLNLIATFYRAFLFSVELCNII